MNKKETQKASINDFLAKKLKRDEEKNKVFNIKISSMDKVITVKKPSDNQILDLLDELGSDLTAKKSILATLRMVYNNSPDLKDTELHKALEIVDPYDIVNTDILFDFADKQEIIEQFNKLSGLESSKKEIDDNVKNS